MIKQFSSKKALLSIVLFCGFLTGSLKVQAIEWLDITQVEQMAMQNYPKIMQQEFEFLKSQEETRIARGDFDAKITGSVAEYKNGYYNGSGLSKFTLKKPLPVNSNVSVYGSYIQRNGSKAYPYDFGGYDTLDSGRTKLGVEVSLLRGFLQNEMYAKLANQRNIQSMSAQELNLVKMKIIADVRQEYYKLVAYYRVYKIYKRMLDTAIARNDNLEKQVKYGDQPRIYLIESQKNIFKRRSMLYNAYTQIVNTQVKLLNYIDPDYNIDHMLMNAKTGSFEESALYFDINDTLPTLDMSIQINENDIPSLISSRPEIVQLMMERENILRNIGVSRNGFLPKLDLKIEAVNQIGSSYYGKAAPSLRDDDTVRGVLELEIPLEFNKVKGKYAKEKASLKANKYKIDLLRNNIITEVTMMQNMLKNLNAVLGNTAQEARIAKELEDAEKEKFRNGGSNFFLINYREQETAKALESQVKAELAKVLNEVELSFATMQIVPR